MTQERIFLECSFYEKDDVKTLGAKFDWEKKRWFIPNDWDTKPFSKWLPVDGEEKEGEEEEDRDSLTLQKLLAILQQTITEQHHMHHWVRAEVLNVSTKEHVYLELVSHDNRGNVNAKVRATLWRSRAETVLTRFKADTGLSFKSGFKVLLHVHIQYNPIYGLSLNILDIDPSFTLGEMEAQLNRIRSRLKKEDIYTQNKDRIQITEFCRVAVIAPKEAAGLGDFKSQADVLTQIGLCDFHYYTASFQGKKMVNDISDAFDLVSQAHKIKAFDAVILIRGGGAKSDLLQLNDYDIAKKVCMAPLPVIIGIGHERDKTLLDEVANQICHTPSLVISHITGTIIQNARNADQNWQMIIRLTRDILNTARAHNEHIFVTLREQTGKILSEQGQVLAVLKQNIKDMSHHHIKQAHYQIKSLIEQVLLGDPKNILNRGYAIIRNEQNTVISSKMMAKKEHVLKIEFKDGTHQLSKK